MQAPARNRPIRVHQRRAFFFFAGLGGARAAVQNAAVPRFAAAVARPLAEPATAFAPLNHMLRNGFFLVHGFFISDSIEIRKDWRMLD